MIFFVLIVSAYAKPKPSPQSLAADIIVAKMKEQLELTDKQAVEVKPVIENYLVEEQQLKLKEKNQLAKILTQDQLYAWNFLENEKRQEKKKRSLWVFG